MAAKKKAASRTAGRAGMTVFTQQAIVISLSPAEQRKAIASGQGVKVGIREERALKVGGQPGQAAVVDLNIDELKRPLVQWQVLTARDGCIFSIYCTTTPQRWEKDRKHFEDFVAGWK